MKVRIICDGRTLWEGDVPELPVEDDLLDLPGFSPSRFVVIDRVFFIRDDGVRVDCCVREVRRQ